MVLENPQWKQTRFIHHNNSFKKKKKRYHVTLHKWKNVYSTLCTLKGRRAAPGKTRGPRLSQIIQESISGTVGRVGEVSDCLRWPVTSHFLISRRSRTRPGFCFLFFLETKGAPANKASHGELAVALLAIYIQMHRAGNLHNVFFFFLFRLFSVCSWMLRGAAL